MYRYLENEDLVWRSDSAAQVLEALEMLTNQKDGRLRTGVNTEVLIPVSGQKERAARQARGRRGPGAGTLAHT